MRASSCMRPHDRRTGMRRRPFVRSAVVAAASLVAMLIVAPSAAPGKRGPLDGPKNLRVSAIAPHSVTLAWDPAVNPSSFTYVIRASFGYQVGVQQTQTSYTWTRDMIPGRTYSFVMWAGDAKGRESARSNTVTVTLPVDTTPPDPPVVAATGATSSTVDLSWPAVADDDYTCCTYRVFANGAQVSADNLHWTGERAVTVLRLAAATTHSFTVVAVDPSHNASAPSAPVSATTPPTLTRPARARRATSTRSTSAARRGSSGKSRSTTSTRSTRSGTRCS